jgi:dimethylargininase
MTLALTREVSESLTSCELTLLPRVPIDIDLARKQHRAYEAALTAAGCVVERLDAGPEIPDSVFVEDLAVVFDELAVITRPGAEPRRAETPAIAEALGRHRRLETIQPPGMIDGGDVLVAGRRVYIGRSSRTNANAVAQMRQLLAPLGYTVCDVKVRRSLHLKSAVTSLGDNLLLVNPEWITKEAFAGFEFVDVDPAEPTGANALRVGNDVIYGAAFPRTAERLAKRGLSLRVVDASELAKAEGAITCCSLIVGRP